MTTVATEFNKSATDVLSSAQLGEWIYEMLSDAKTPVNHDRLRFLLASGADASWSTKQHSQEHLRNGLRGGTTLLMQAIHVHGADTESARILAEAGSDVHARTNEGCTALEYAVAGNAIATAKMLIGREADVNAVSLGGNNLLIPAAHYGRTEIVKLLLDKKASTDHRDYCGQTALMLAAQEGHAEIVGLLIEAGADIAQKSDRGLVAVDYARWNKHATPIHPNPNAEVIRLLENAAIKATTKPAPPQPAL